GEQLAFEIEPRRQAHVRVGGAREAVGAAMLAAAIRVDRAVERNIRRLIPRDDPPGLLLLYLCLERRQQIERPPAIVRRVTGERLKAAGAVALRAPPTTPVRVDADADVLGAWFAEGDSLTGFHEKIPIIRIGTKQEHMLRSAQTHGH